MSVLNWSLLLPLAVIVRFIYYRYASPLRSYPGPFLASGSRAWKVWSTFSGKNETHFIRLHEKYGPIVRIAPSELSFASPAAARQILAAGKGFHKTDFYTVFPPYDYPDIFTETRESVHAVKKRYASGPYSMASMQNLSPYIDDTIKLLASKLNDSIGKHNGIAPVDLGKQLHFFAFDVLGEVAFSKKFGFLETGQDVEGAIKTIDDMQWYHGLCGQVPEWNWVFRRNPVVEWLAGSGPENFLVMRMAKAALMERKASTQLDERHDLLSQLLAANLKAPDKFEEGDVMAVAHGAIFAGSDSTGSTMQSFCHHVIRDSRIYNKLREEIHEAATTGRLSEIPQWSETQALPYFQACLKEAMRLRPAVGLNITRLVPPEGADIDGQFFPGGTRVAVNAWVLHRDTQVFGTDAKLYRPERWLEGDAKSMDKYMFQFGGGSHVCIGKNLALLEMNKTLPFIFREYDLALVRPKEDLKYHSSFFVVQTGLDVQVSKRKHT